ncbi:hypothetical protein RSal33209_1366 [Renibacterium salmoninarum ATCC 33209]|uniref:Uncharacterized protein n=2 Tax=Renibacterium salmoninarum TaxID=1646 RepID=A9WPU6_RENSM|nr:hypothetical protein [Renibacterium salmoninarum]ABY23103.1 hypothetical protein RSal33209_1366 [Renibacterium salmoninarum ATCC 33209]
MQPWISLVIATAVPAMLTSYVAFLAGLSRNRHSMIDQLQEERTLQEAQITDLEHRIDAFYADKHASRIYVAALLDHIWQRKEPPPPDPPAGYIP